MPDIKFHLIYKTPLIWETSSDIQLIFENVLLIEDLQVTNWKLCVQTYDNFYSIKSTTLNPVQTI